MKKWVVLNKQKADNSQPFGSTSTSLSINAQGKHITEKEIISILLKNRGLTKKKEIEEFLNPSLDSVNLKELGLDKKKVDKAVKRIKKAIDSKESIVVYTDYDVDGLTGGAIVWETLFEFGAKVMPYIPHRIREGYGLSKQGIDNVKKEFHPSLIITVDLGISAGKLIDYANKQEIDTIIIDHHLLPAKLPEACAIVHTTKLAAGTIAWFFSCYLMSYLTSKQINKFFLKDLDLAAMATIADMIPLIGVNRTIVKYGLKQLNQTKRIGLTALINESSLNKGEIGAYEVGRILAPRINALGRLAHAMDALRLICTRDEERAVKLAKTLGLVNRDRQVLMEETTNHALRLVEGKTNRKIIFAAHESYQQGVIGLVAGKLVEQFSRPAIVVSKGKDYSKASARSINGINILEIIRKSSALLVDVGGHPMAAGFTIATKNLGKFERRMQELMSAQLKSETKSQEIKIDMEMDINQITSCLFQQIQLLAPFGIGNPEPVFISRNTRVLTASLVGKNRQHLKLTLLKNNNNTIQVIGFNKAEFYTKLHQEALIDIVYTIEQDTWNGNACLQLKLKDVNMAG